jgi:hypothetical protein
VDEQVLAKELEQLGLPKGAPTASASTQHAHADSYGTAEHAESVCKPYSKDRERLRAAVVAATLQLVRPLSGAARCMGVARQQPQLSTACAARLRRGAADATRNTQDPLVLTRWGVDLPLASGGDGQSLVEGAAAGGPTIRLEFAAPGGAGASEAFATDEAQLRLLVYELKQAREAMQAASDA